MDSSEGEASDLIAMQTSASAASSCVLVSSQRLVCSANATLPRQSQIVSNPQEHHVEQRGVISSCPLYCRMIRSSEEKQGVACAPTVDRSCCPQPFTYLMSSDTLSSNGYFSTAREYVCTSLIAITWEKKSPNRDQLFKNPGAMC